jgi:hypothetical protein
LADSSNPHYIPTAIRFVGSRATLPNGYERRRIDYYGQVSPGRFFWEEHTLRKLRWEVEQTRYTTSDCEAFIRYRSRFRNRESAFEYWQRERDHGRLFLDASIYLRLPCGRRKLMRLRANEPDVLRSLIPLFKPSSFSFRTASELQLAAPPARTEGSSEEPLQAGIGQQFRINHDRAVLEDDCNHCPF